jgi:hypothetical protein
MLVTHFWQHLAKNNENASKIQAAGIMKFLEASHKVKNTYLQTTEMFI